MKINAIKLTNFLCYSGEDNEIRFDEGLNLIIGANGYGKTKLYDAFHWVFFDWITDQKGNSKYTADLKKDLISKKALETTKSGTVLCKVEIEVQTNKSNYLLTRKYFVNKTENGELREADKSSIKVEKKNVLEYLPLKLGENGDYKDFEEFVNIKIIPTNILAHIWFQGERGISKAIDTSNASTLHSVISKISYIDIWEKYIEISGDAYRRTKDEFDRKMTTSTKKKNEYELKKTQLNNIDKKIQRNEDILKNCQQEYSLLDENLDKITLSSEAQDKVYELKVKQQSSKKDISLLSDSIKVKEDRIDRDLFDFSWIIHGTTYMHEQFDEMYRNYGFTLHQELQELNKNIRLPELPKGSPKETDIREMLKKEHCLVCDRPAPKDSEYYENIKRLLPINYPTTNKQIENGFHKKILKNISESNISITISSKYFQTKAEAQQETYFKQADKLRELNENEEKLKETEIQLLSNLGLNSLEDGIINVKNIRSLVKDRDKLTREITILQNTLKEDREEFEKINQSIVDSGKNEVDELLIKKLSYFESLHKASKDAKSSQYIKLVTLLEEETNKHYENINKNTGAFYGVIKFHRNPNTEGYYAKIHDDNDSDVTDNLNTSQILAMRLSILLAILSTNKKKNFNKKYPLISDAPNSAFDAKKRLSLLKEIGSTFDQSIVMMFEYLINDPERPNRYMIDKTALHQLTTEMQNLGVKINVIMLDIPNEINPKQMNQLSIAVNKIKL